MYARPFSRVYTRQPYKTATVVLFNTKMNECCLTYEIVILKQSIYRQMDNLL